MSTKTHPYFIGNGDSAEQTAVLLTGTAEEYGLDQREIQATQGGFNVSEAVYEAVYGEQPDNEATVDTEDLDPAEPIVTGTPKDGTDTRAVVGDGSDPGDQAEVDTADGVAEQHGEVEGPDYEAWEYAALKTEVATRGLEVEDQKKDTLVAALVADDEAQDDDSL